MLVQKWWRWILSKRLPDTPKYRKYTALIYAGVVWQLCILTYIYHFKQRGMHTSEAQKAALLKYHQRDTVHSITIDGLSMVERKVISGMQNQQQDEAQ